MKQKTPYKISLKQARRYALRKQLLLGTPVPKGKRGVLEVINKLGYVQIDTISVVERSHHIVLYTRCPAYKKVMLHELQAQDKKIFEYWAHAASFVPMEDYRYYVPAMKRAPKEGSWLDRWPRQNPRLLIEVKKRVTREGPLAASDFADVKDRKRGPWWDWKPAKAALEVLFWRGELMIKERKNFQRVYDLTERTLPRGLNTTPPPEDEEKRFFITRALTALGVATQQDINRYIGISGRLNTWTIAMVKDGIVSTIQVEKCPNTYYILTQDMDSLDTVDIPAKSLHFLSPFDNAIILRDRTSLLFGFEYALECYVPEKKRKYGYFCLPIVWQDRFAGMIDLKSDRAEKRLHVRNLHLNSRYTGDGIFLRSCSRALEKFGQFNGCDAVLFEKDIRPAVRKKFASYL